MTTATQTRQALPTGEPRTGLILFLNLWNGKVCRKVWRNKGWDGVMYFATPKLLMTLASLEAPLNIVWSTLPWTRLLITEASGRRCSLGIEEETCSLLDIHHSSVSRWASLVEWTLYWALCPVTSEAALTHGSEKQKCKVLRHSRSESRGISPIIGSRL